MQKKFKIIILCLLVLLVMGCGKEKKQKVMKVGIGVPESHFEYKGMMEFKKYIEKETGGNIQVEVFPSNQIGVDSEVLEQIQIGVSQMNLPDPAVLGNYVSEFNLLSLPFLFKDKETAIKITKGEWGKKLLSKLEENGYVGLGFGPFGFRHVSNSKKPIENLDDFEGLKIRTMSNNSHLEVFRELGTNPTPMPFSELFSALQQGVVDGQENPLMNIYSNKLHEVQKYITLDGHVFSWVVFVVGRDFYDSLSLEEQKILQKASDVAIDYMSEELSKDDQLAMEEMKKAGVEFTIPTDEFIREIKSTVQPTVDKFGKEIDAELYEELLTEIKKYN